LYDVLTTEYTTFPFFLISWFNTIQILWTFDFSLKPRLLDWSVLPLPLSELFISWMLPVAVLLRTAQSTYLYQVYMDNRRRISQYQIIWS